MTEAQFRKGDRLLRTGVSLPHLGVHAGQIYEVESCDLPHAETVYLKDVIEPLDPASFRAAPLEA